MSFENRIVLAASTFGSVYLCAKSLEQINKRDNFEISIPNIFNYLMLGFSSGMLLVVTKRVLDTNSN